MWRQLIRVAIFSLEYFQGSEYMKILACPSSEYMKWTLKKGSSGLARLEMRHPGLVLLCFWKLILIHFYHSIVSVPLPLLQENTANHVACEYHYVSQFWKLQSKITAPADLVCGNPAFCFVDSAFKFVLRWWRWKGQGCLKVPQASTLRIQTFPKGPDN